MKKNIGMICLFLAFVGCATVQEPDIARINEDVRLNAPSAGGFVNANLSISSDLLDKLNFLAKTGSVDDVYTVNLENKLQVFYVCDTGSDENDGLSHQTSWQTYEKARTKFADLKAGEVIAFCRGGVFYTENLNRWVNPECKADNPCVVRDYSVKGFGAEEKPKIITEGTVFNLADKGNTSHEEGYVFKNLSLEGAGVGYGVVVTKDADDILIDSLDINNFGIGVSVKDGTLNELGTDSDGVNERITLINSTITNNGDQGYLGACNDCKIINTKFQNNGFNKARRGHNLYISGIQDTTNMLVSGNEFYQSNIVDGICQGTSVTVHGIHKNLLIENNFIHEDLGAVRGGCWGISIAPGYDSVAESFEGVIIKNNVIKNMGAIAIGCTSCFDAVIEGNVIINRQDIPAYGIVLSHRINSVIDDAETKNIQIIGNNIQMTQVGVGIHLREAVMEVIQINNNITKLLSEKASCIAQKNVLVYSEGLGNTCVYE